MHNIMKWSFYNFILLQEKKKEFDVPTTAIIFKLHLEEQ